MANFEINSKINYLLKSDDNRPAIVDIVFLGTGGAFDFEEKNSSVLLKTSKGGVLIDCGSTVFSQLQSKNLIDDVDYVFITHTHEDHIGSLSTLVYYKHFVKNKVVKIECTEDVGKRVEDYLVNVCSHPTESFSINSNKGNVYKDLNVRVYKIDTTNYHYRELPSSGFVFNYRKNKKDFFILFSGDLNCSFLDVIKKCNQNLYSSLLKEPEGVFVFHEAAESDYAPYYPHCKFTELRETIKIFPNFYIYHHSKKEYENILESAKEEYVNIKKLIIIIENELKDKLDKARGQKCRESLKTQAKELKEYLVENSYNIIKIKSVDNVGSDFFIKEKEK